LIFKKIQQELKTFSSLSTAKALKRFFKTQKGAYAENDLFRGIYVPKLRIITKKIKNVPFNVIKKLLHSKYHEDRMLALLFLLELYRKASDDKTHKKILYFYLQHASHINNWDLVDISAPNIPGKYLLNHSRKILYKFAHSKNMWKRRIAIVSTLSFVRQNDFEDALKLAAMLISDKEDLIQKATGWVLREVGKRDKSAELHFLKTHIKEIKSLTLSYATEKFSSSEKKAIYQLYYARK
jgi:3-methyladenine DNA glycosylase AlkD